MICSVRMTLLRNYKQVTAVHAKCVSELHREIGVSSKREYDALKRQAENARLEVAKAFDALEQHVMEHGCGSETLVIGAGGL